MCLFPVIDMIQTGLNIKRLRVENGLSVRALQEKFGFATSQSIYHWENGSNLPSIDNLLALSSLYHVRIEDILICVVPTPPAAACTAA